MGVDGESVGDKVRAELEKIEGAKVGEVTGSCDDDVDGDTKQLGFVPKSDISIKLRHVA